MALASVFVVALSGCGQNSTSSPAQRATPSPTPLPTAAPSPTPGLFVDAGADLGPISPYVYGTNDGPWLVVNPILDDQVVAAKLTMVSFPGGNWGDENDLQQFQIDDFIAYCRKIGAEPRIVVRLKGGTPEKAAELVKYANVTMGYGVKYWGIGNEPDLYEANGLTGYSVAQYDTDWRSFAVAMRAIDPKIKLIGPDISQFVGNTNGSSYLQARTDWLSSFLTANGDLVDIVSVHRYAFPASTTSGPPSIADLRANSQEWDSIIPALKSVVRTQLGRDLPVAVTEVNSSWADNQAGEATMDSHYNAIWFGDVLGRLISQKVDIVTQFALAGDWGILGLADVHPIYYDYLMYQRFGSELLRSASDDPLLSVYAAKRADGTLTVMIVNLDSTAATKPLTVIGGTTADSAETWLFDASHNAEQVAETPLAPGGNVTLPPESITLLVTGL
jgi:hypothetical protein